MHGGESNDATIGQRDEGRRITTHAQAGEPRGYIRRRSGIAEVPELFRHRVGILVTGRPDLDVVAHFRNGDRQRARLEDCDESSRAIGCQSRSARYDQHGAIR